MASIVNIFTFTVIVMIITRQVSEARIQLPPRDSLEYQRHIYWKNNRQSDYRIYPNQEANAELRKLLKILLPALKSNSVMKKSVENSLSGDKRYPYNSDLSSKNLFNSNKDPYLSDSEQFPQNNAYLTQSEEYAGLIPLHSEEADESIDHSGLFSLNDLFSIGSYSLNNKHSILHNLRKSCSKKDKKGKKDYKKCYKACKSALKDICSEYNCKKIKSAFKSECRANCRERY